ncbi:hypothetical protein [Oceanobacillus sp. SE10311]
MDRISPPGSRFRESSFNGGAGYSVYLRTMLLTMEKVVTDGAA